MTKWDLVQGMQARFIIQKSINVTMTLRLTKKNHMIIATEAGRTSYQIQHSLMI